jgi:hypothetical protein
MNVSPTQRLVNYLREFPPVRPLDRASQTEEARPTNRAEAASQARAAEPAQRPAAPRPAAAMPPPSARPADGTARRLLPRGSLLNIVT